MNDAVIVSVEMKGHRRGDAANIQLSNGRVIKTTLIRDFNPNIAKYTAPTSTMVAGVYTNYQQQCITQALGDLNPLEPFMLFF